MPDSIRFRQPAEAAGFTILPNVVLRSPRLGPGAKTTYALLRDFARQEAACFPGQERLAQLVPCSRRAVQEYLRELQALGLITIQRRGARTNLYWLEPVEDQALGG